MNFTLSPTPMNQPGYVNIDELQAATSLAEAAAKCGIPLDVKGSGAEVRIDCPFGCAGDHAGRKEVAINTDNPQKVFMCHAYECRFRGNLLTLLHGWTTGRKPSGEKLKGEEFQRVKRILAGQVAGAPAPRTAREPQAAPPVEPPPVNLPLAASPEAKVRELHDIDRKFLVDPAAMNPAAAAYVRRHPALSPESLHKWRAGYLPNDGGGDKRGWSLRGSLVYPVQSEDGQVLAWVSRDVQYEQKEREYAALTPAERSGQEPPAKHRFPKGFQRGLELFGQQASRLKEPGYREFIARHGLIVCEGFNDVIGLDNLQVPSVGIMSNRITAAQADKIATWARQLAGGKVTLLFDCEATGDEGAKDCLWQLAERGLPARLGWSQNMHGGAFKGRQPESLKADELSRLLGD